MLIQSNLKNLINDQLLDMDAELKVMENTIKADGFDVKKQDRTQVDKIWL